MEEVGPWSQVLGGILAPSCFLLSASRPPSSEQLSCATYFYLHDVHSVHAFGAK
jgi:hypothetical protein